MHKHCPRPIVMPLSNATSRVEATPQNILSWTDGEALVATGSPFYRVTVKGKQYPIAQCSQLLYLPGYWTGGDPPPARRGSPTGMLMAASETLAQHSPLVQQRRRSGAAGAEGYPDRLTGDCLRGGQGGGGARRGGEASRRSAAASDQR